jgi:hypothetical protein
LDTWQKTADRAAGGNLDRARIREIMLETVERVTGKRLDSPTRGVIHLVPAAFDLLIEQEACASGAGHEPRQLLRGDISLVENSVDQLDRRK